MEYLKTCARALKNFRDKLIAFGNGGIYKMRILRWFLDKLLDFIVFLINKVLEFLDKIDKLPRISVKKYK